MMNQSGHTVSENKVLLIDDSLKSQAQSLVNLLESGDEAGALEIIESMHQSRDRTMFEQVGKLTRRLHDSIVNFHLTITDSETDNAPMGDASDRLNYVMNMTDNAANKTMDMVEEAVPVAQSLHHRAAELRGEWDRLIRRDMTADEFRELYKRLGSFLDDTVNESSQLKGQINNILMAQDYQDLTGQVLKKVIDLIRDVQENLVSLVRMAAEVEELIGINTATTAQESVQESKTSEQAEGPIMNASERDDVCHNQDEVDDLLSSLGF